MNKSFWLGGFLGAGLAFFIFSSTVKFRRPQSEPVHQVAPAPIISFSATLDDVYKILSARGVANIEQAVALFDDRFFADRNFALVYDSRSTPSASFTSPRTLLFGDKSKLTVAFNHRVADGRGLQAIQWRADERLWELREIRFSAQGPRLSSANPQLCMDCHGRDPRPIWDGYPVWTGVYGSSFQIYHPETEVSGYDGFLRARESDGIYSRLELAGLNTDVDQTYEADIQILERDNAVHNLQYGNLNVRRIARQLKTHLQQKSLVYPILSILVGCPGLTDYFKDSKFNAFLRKENALTKKVALKEHQRILFRQARGEMATVDAFVKERAVSSPYAYADHELENIKYIAPLRAVLVYFEGLDTETWSTSYMERGLSHSNSRGATLWADLGGDPDVTSLYQSLLSEFQITGYPSTPPTMSSLTKKNSDTATPAFCLKIKSSFASATKIPLRRLSAKSTPEFMSDFVMAEVFDERAINSGAAEKIMKKNCASCHDGRADSQAPPLPLTSLAELGSYKNGLAAQCLRTFKMPREDKSLATLTLKERATLIYYLEKTAMAPLYEKYFRGQDHLLDDDLKTAY